MLKTSALETEKQDNLEKLQAIITNKEEVIDNLQKVSEEREHHIGSLEKEVAQLHNVIEVKEQLILEHNEKEKKLEDQTTEVICRSLIYRSSYCQALNLYMVHCRIRHC